LQPLVVALWKGDADTAQSQPCMYDTAIKAKLLKKYADLVEDQNGSDIRNALWFYALTE